MKLLFKTPYTGFLELLEKKTDSELYVPVKNIIDYVGEVIYPNGKLDSLYQIKYEDQNGNEFVEDVFPVESELQEYIRFKTMFQTKDLSNEQILMFLEDQKIKLLTDVATETDTLTLTYVEDDIFTLPNVFVIDKNFGGNISNNDVIFYDYPDDDNTIPNSERFYEMYEYDEYTRNVRLRNQTGNTTIYMKCWYTDRKPHYQLYKQGLAYLTQLDQITSSFSPSEQGFSNNETGEIISVPLGGTIKVGQITLGSGNPYQLSNSQVTIFGQLKNLYNNEVKSKLFKQRREMLRDGRKYLNDGLFEAREYQ